MTSVLDLKWLIGKLKGAALPVVLAVMVLVPLKGVINAIIKQNGALVAAAVYIGFALTVLFLSAAIFVIDLLIKEICRKAKVNEEHEKRVLKRRRSTDQQSRSVREDARKEPNK